MGVPTGLLKNAQQTNKQTNTQTNTRGKAVRCGTTAEHIPLSSCLEPVSRATGAIGAIEAIGAGTSDVCTCIRSSSFVSTACGVRFFSFFPWPSDVPSQKLGCIVHFVVPQIPGFPLGHDHCVSDGSSLHWGNQTWNPVKNNAGHWEGAPSKSAECCLWRDHSLSADTRLQSRHRIFSELSGLLRVGFSMGDDPSEKAWDEIGAFFEGTPFGVGLKGNCKTKTTHSPMSTWAQLCAGRSLWLKTTDKWQNTGVGLWFHLPRCLSGLHSLSQRMH